MYNGQKEGCETSHKFSQIQDKGIWWLWSVLTKHIHILAFYNGTCLVNQTVYLSLALIKAIQGHSHVYMLSDVSLLDVILPLSLCWEWGSVCFFIKIEYRARPYAL